MRAARAAMISALLAFFFACSKPKLKPKPPAALFPGSLIVTYYGNPLSKKMGILGQLPPDEMMRRLDSEAQSWRRLDQGVNVRPGLELVAVVASDKPEGGLYRTRASRRVIEEVIGWARSRGWPTILDIQVGHSTVRAEVNYLRPYLEQPDVELALDPEFQMPPGEKPGRRIGTSDAEDVNVAILALSKIVQDYHLPPKLLLVHRFTDGMLRHYQRVRLVPQVQVAIIMDGFGTPKLKKAIYRREIGHELVEYTGIKLFYKNDRPMMTRAQVLGLDPKPSVIIYQ